MDKFRRNGHPVQSGTFLPTYENYVMTALTVILLSSILSKDLNFNGRWSLQFVANIATRSPSYPFEN
eukprot:scaffold16972_cov94-Skeletonema_dohrnii-CCMP3373.AAC.7